MREKNIYQCDANCQFCKYEKKNPTGYDDLDECTTDVCPNNHVLLGNIDKLQGRHSEGYGWNPLGEFCNICKHTSCEDCIKWSNREKKLRNNIPTELKSPKKQPVQETKPEPIFEEEKETTNQNIIEQALKIMEDEKRTKDIHTANQTIIDMGHTFIDTERVKDTRDELDDFDINDFDSVDIEDEYSNESVESEIETTTFNNNDIDTEDTDADIEINDNRDDELVEDLDFGIEPTISDSIDDYADGNISFSDDDIPQPDEYENFEESDDDEKEEDDDEDDEEDDDYEDYDEDDEAEFSLFEQTRKLKASILFAPDTKIAQYNVRNNGVYLTVEGDAKVTVKGRNDSDGFSYCDPNRFPRYVREGILNGELYKNDNIKITDNSKFIFVYYHKIDDDLIKKDTMECKTDLTDASEEKLRKLLKVAMDKFQAKN